MSRGVELVFVIRQKIVVLPQIEPTMAKGVFIAIKVRYNEPIFTLLEIMSFATSPYATMCNQMSPMITNGCLCNYFSNLDEVWSSFHLGYDYDLFHR
jgi:hypothetical protein